MSETPIRTEGTITRVLREDFFFATLPNGKQVNAHFSRELAKDSPTLVAGDRVILELTPFDFDSARIAAKLD